MGRFILDNLFIKLILKNIKGIKVTLNIDEMTDEDIEVDFTLGTFSSRSALMIMEDFTIMYDLTVSQQKYGHKVSTTINIENVLCFDNSGEIDLLDRQEDALKQSLINKVFILNSLT